MPIKVYKVGDIIRNKVVFNHNGKFRLSDLAAVLTNLHAVDDPLPGHGWKLDLIIGEGNSAREICIDLPLLLPKWYRPDVPFFIKKDSPPPPSALIVYFYDRLYMPERLPMSVLEKEEIILRIKKAIYEDKAELSSLRAAVANLEAATEFQKSGPNAIQYLRM